MKWKLFLLHPQLVSLNSTDQTNLVLFKQMKQVSIFKGTIIYFWTTTYNKPREQHDCELTEKYHISLSFPLESSSHTRTIFTNIKYRPHPKDGKGNIFTLCVSQHLDGGGTHPADGEDTPIPGQDGGYSHLRSRTSGVPNLRSRTGGTPVSGPGWGYPI